ncbi:MAG TPA: hypothetical protein PKE40_11775 [Arachnia sp.]|nr:hypothetical protein [Arachnia sp.]HMT87024.1 hypothetical protein [Arachnia sp.]
MTEVWRLLGEALRLYPSLFEDVGLSAYAMLDDALGIAGLAAVSTMLGHVAVLLLNRIHGARLVVSMVLSIVAFALLHVVEASVTWTVASLVVERPLPWLPIVVVALTATAPQVFHFLTAIPHIGMFIGRVLQAWSFLVLVMGITHAYNTVFLTALGYALAGWLAMQLLTRLMQKPLAWAGSHAWTLVTGTPTMVTADDILAGMPIIPVIREQAPVEEARA